MKSLLIAAIFAVCLPLAANAKTYPIPSDDPIATVTLPDSWDVTETDDGIEATSKDELVTISIEAGDLIDVKAATAEALQGFADDGVTIDATTQKQTDFEINGMKGFEIGFKGKDEDGPTNVSVSIVVVSEKKVLNLTYQASDAGEKNNAEALGQILHSIQATKK